MLSFSQTVLGKLRPPQQTSDLGGQRVPRTALKSQAQYSQVRLSSLWFPGVPRSTDASSQFLWTWVFRHLPGKIL